MKKVIIVGGGASGIFLALLLAKKNPIFSIEIIEKEEKLGKKLRATGNGHANLLNANLDLRYYNPNSALAKKIVPQFSVDDLINQYNEWGVLLSKVNDLYYPMCYHAPSFTNHLIELLKAAKVKISLGVSFLDYRHVDDRILVTTSEGQIQCDDLIITSGGKSAKNLGSDGTIFAILARKNYKITPLEAGLTPILAQKTAKMSLFGLRHKVLATLKNSANSTIYQESGEYTYKRDGLSGICIMNIASMIKWHHLKEPTIHLDLFPGEDVSKYIDENSKNDAILEYPLYFEVLEQAKKRKISFNEALHDLIYVYKSSYDFENSQVTIGGIDDSCVNFDLSSALEKHVFFAGEILNVDGLCGGFNLAWALMSAIVVSRSI